MRTWALDPGGPPGQKEPPSRWYPGRGPNGTSVAAYADDLRGDELGRRRPIVNPPFGDLAHVEGPLIRALGGGGVPAPRDEAPTPPAPLPCQNRNNSTGGAYLFERDLRTTLGGFRGSDGRTWANVGEGQFLRCFDGPSSAERKAAFALRLNVEAFVQKWGREHCAFWTLTDAERCHPAEFARRWNSFLAHHGDWILAFIRVLEPQLRKAPHYHLVTAVRWDLRPDTFDWEAFLGAQEARCDRNFERAAELTRKYALSTVPETRALWRRLRTVLPRYGLGRSEFCPMRKEVGAVVQYVGKYLEAGLKIRVQGWKGTRRIETDRRTSPEWKKCSRRFSWNSEGARRWRARVGELGLAVGAADIGDLKGRLWKRWAYHLRGYITVSTDEEWAEFLPVMRDYAAARSSMRVACEAGDDDALGHWAGPGDPF